MTICFNDMNNQHKGRTPTKLLDGKISETVQIPVKAVTNNHLLKGPTANCHHNGRCAVNGTAVAAMLIDQSRSFMNLHIQYVHWIVARLPNCDIWGFSSPTLGNTCHT